MYVRQVLQFHSRLSDCETAQQASQVEYLAFILRRVINPTGLYPGSFCLGGGAFLKNKEGIVTTAKIAQ